MTCYSCGSENTKASALNHFVDLGTFFIIIRNVPCVECLDCGEKILSGEVIAQIEEIVGSLKPLAGSTAVTVIDYPHKVA